MVTQIYTGHPAFLEVTITPTPTRLPNRTARLVEIVNTTDKDILVSRSNVGATARLRSGLSHIFKLEENASELFLSTESGTAQPDIIECWG